MILQSGLGSTEQFFGWSCLWSPVQIQSSEGLTGCRVPKMVSLIGPLSQLGWLEHPGACWPLSFLTGHLDAEQWLRRVFPSQAPHSEGLLCSQYPSSRDCWGSRGGQSPPQDMATGEAGPSPRRRVPCRLTRKCLQEAANSGSFCPLWSLRGSPTLVMTTKWLHEGSYKIIKEDQHLLCFYLCLCWSSD